MTSGTTWEDAHQGFVKSVKIVIPLMAGGVDRFRQILPFLMCLLYMDGFNGFGIEEKPLS